MRIRRLREFDHRAIVRVADEWWGGRRVSEKLPRLFFRYFGETSFVVEKDGRIVAFLVGFVSQSQEDEAYIHFVGVDPGYRGRDIGKRLYEAFFEEMRLRGYRRVRCTPRRSTRVPSRSTGGWASRWSPVTARWTE